MKPEQLLTRQAATVYLLILWSLFIDTGCWSVVTAPALPTTTPPGAAALATATAISPVETRTPSLGRFPGAGPESTIQEKSKKVTFRPSDQKWFALPIDEITGKAIVDLRILGMEAGAIDKLVDAGVLKGEIYALPTFNQLDQWRRKKDTKPVPVGRLTKMADPAGARLPWDGGDRNSVNGPSFFPNLPKGAWILSVTNTGPQPLDSLFSVK